MHSTFSPQSRSSLWKATHVAALGATLALGLAACGSDAAVPTDSTGSDTTGAPAPAATSEWSGSLQGAGASSQEAAQNAWMATFRQSNPDANINYNPVGSGAGITKLASGEVSWAGSDAVMDDEERAGVEATCGSPALHLPMYISPIAVVFKLDGVDSLQLDAATIARIFTGEVTSWDDPAIAEQNPDVTLPATPITPIHRADKSGTTENFTEYLHAVAPDAWTAEPDKSWPIAGGESADKTAGVISAVSNGNGTISYADASQVGDLGTVRLKSGDEYVAYSEQAAAKAAEAATAVEGLAEHDLGLVVDRKGSGGGAYPLILISYEIVCSQYSDADTAEGIRAYMHYLASEAGQQVAHNEAGSAPLSPALADKVAAAIDSVK